MSEKITVVALGHRALGTTLPEQKIATKKAAKAIADLVEAGNRVVISHSNGPQVGMIHTAMNEFGKAHPNYTFAPMSVCSAMSQGYIGYDLQTAIRAELLSRGIYKPVATIITQVRVDPFDPAFHNPTKVIGRKMTKAEAELEEKKGNYVVEDDGAYRRIIASPKPIDIYEIDSIRTLVDAGQIVIAAGGGGIPVLDQRTALKGASAIIEKDYTAAKLADMLDASMLLLLTDHDYLIINKDEENERELKEITIAEASALIDENKFKSLTKLPKIEAAINFVESGSDRTAVITNLTKAKEGACGKIGTILKSE